jgi:hypothetical protein
MTGKVASIRAGRVEGQVSCDLKPRCITTHATRSFRGKLFQVEDIRMRGALRGYIWVAPSQKTYSMRARVVCPG